MDVGPVSEILKWLAAGFGTANPIEFKSREGRGCCDMGDTGLNVLSRPDDIYFERQISMTFMCSATDQVCI
jgi:hypothetical protein